MTETILEHAPAIRLGIFFTIFFTMMLWEIAREKRRLQTSKRSRWIANLLIIVTDSAVARLVLPMGAIGLAAIASARGWGLFNIIEAPPAVAIIASIVALDFFIWLQHVVFHSVPVLWRVHMMHHADLDIDVTTGSRFHPIEMVLSLGIKVAVIALLGPPVIAVLLFEIILNATALFNHSNIHLPAPIDRVLRLFVVTPDMHRVHHSVEPNETNTNFGFNLPWWDRLCGTYKAQPAAGHEAMEIGLKQLRDPQKNTFWRLLLLPFTAPSGDYDISHREIESAASNSKEAHDDHDDGSH